MPLAFTAAIVNVYEVFDAKFPVTVNGLVVPDTDRAIDGLEDATYEVIVDQPVAPDVNGIERVVSFVRDTVPIVGA